jgi:hypothetical protein
MFAIPYRTHTQPYIDAVKAKTVAKTKKKRAFRGCDLGSNKFEGAVGKHHSFIRLALFFMEM